MILALGQDTDTGFLRAVPGVEFERDGTVIVSRTLDDRLPRRLRRRRHGAERAHRHRRRRPRQEGRPPHRRLAAQRAAASAPKHAGRDVRQAAPLVLRRRRRAGSSRSSRPSERVADFGEIVGGLSADEAALRGAPLPLVRQLLRMRRLLRRLPRGRGHQARRRATATGSTTTRCTGCATCFEQCPCTRSRWSRRA